jgi:S-formylglutathione hydrolase FrmB
MRVWVIALRGVLIAVLALCLWTAPQGRAANVEYLMVPSGAMGRDIPVAFMGGGPHAVYLLDAFDAGDTVSNWVTAGNAFNTLAGKGVSVVAPAGGAYSLYTDWEADGSKQWETFLSAELPTWLAANKGLAAGGHAIVGASQGGTGAITLAEFHPDRFSYAGSMSGFLTPGATTLNGAITAGMMQYGGVTPTTCGGCRNWAAGNGTIPTPTSNCSSTTAPGYGYSAPAPFSAAIPRQ